MHRSSASASLSNSGNGSRATPRSRCRDARWKPCLARTAWYCAALAVGLQAGAASALSFNFSFSGGGNPTSPATVTGTVSGLVDNQNNQTTGLTVTISSATNTPPGGWRIFTDVYSGSGFNVVAGQITSADIRFTDQTPFAQYLILSNTNSYSSQLVDETFPDPDGYDNFDLGIGPTNTLRFTPVNQAQVPGPLPLFGAAAAFGWSRRLRRRFQSPL